MAAARFPGAHPTGGWPLRHTANHTVEVARNLPMPGFPALRAEWAVCRAPIMALLLPRPMDHREYLAAHAGNTTSTPRAARRASPDVWFHENAWQRACRWRNRSNRRDRRPGTRATPTHDVPSFRHSSHAPGVFSGGKSPAVSYCKCSQESAISSSPLFPGFTPCATIT